MIIALLHILLSCELTLPQMFPTMFKLREIRHFLIKHYGVVNLVSYH